MSEKTKQGKNWLLAEVNGLKSTSFFKPNTVYVFWENILIHPRAECICMSGAPFEIPVCGRTQTPNIKKNSRQYEVRLKFLEGKEKAFQGRNMRLSVELTCIIYNISWKNTRHYMYMYMQKLKWLIGLFPRTNYMWRRDGAVVRALASHRWWPGFDSRTRRHMWVEFVVGSRPCSEGFSPGSPVFLPPQKPTPNSNSIWKWGPRVCQLCC